MKLSVNILAWNCLPYLKESLFQIMEEVTLWNSEVIIVDNGSNDGTKEFVEKQLYVYNNLRYNRLENNLGISKGKNIGINLSKGDYILLLDADIIPVMDSIRCMVVYLDDHKECDAIGFYPEMWSTLRNNSYNKHRKEG